LATASPESAVDHGRVEVEVRIEATLLDGVREHVEDFSRGEEAGYLICSVSALPGQYRLLAREWLPVPEWAIERNAYGSVLSWSAKFNGEALQRAFDLNATPVLVHSHGTTRPRFSQNDTAKERSMFAPASRMLDPFPTGSLLLGEGHAIGSFWQSGRNDVAFRRLVILDSTIDAWHPGELRPRRRTRLARLAPVIGPKGDATLAEARVAVVGISGGGSHVVQQLAHSGIGTIIPIDDDTIDETNLGRVVGATYHDIGKTLKTDLAERAANAIDPEIVVDKEEGRFPSAKTIAALKSADVIVSCVDTFRAREAINLFSRRYMIPLVDIGMTIKSRGERLARADGQLIVSIPGQPCLRCWFLTDAVLEREQRERPAGYDRNPEAVGDPQVVSMNGVLASEACNCVLDLLTGYSGGERGPRWWLYEGRSGQLEQFDLPPRRRDCPACAEQRLGDPATAQTELSQGVA
jgi:molybdopterin/thiamine biosynthesis adenylyltransferase